MRRVYKKARVDFAGVTISVKVYYPKRNITPKFKIVHSFFEKLIFLGLPISLLLFSIFQFNKFFDNNAYLTKSSPFSSEVYFSETTRLVSQKKVNEPTGEKIVFHGSRDKKLVALTFDADMTPEMKLDLQTGYVASYYDQYLIGILNETNTKATLFLSGMWIESYPDIAKELAVNPLFELGNHTYSHPAFHSACFGLIQAYEDHKKEELTKTQKLLKEVTGFDNKLFRFPGGCYSDSDLDIVSTTGQTAIQWDVAGQDGFNGDTEQIVSNVVDNVTNGSIIVLHMNGYPNEPATAYALPIIITSLKEKGYEFVTITELLDLKQDSIRTLDKYLNFTH